jgi:hypothetical protein
MRLSSRRALGFRCSFRVRLSHKSLTTSWALPTI